jgi:formiminoglutamase
MTTEDSEALGWRSVQDLLGDHPDASVALVGAGVNERSLTPGRCDVGPRALRSVLGRFSTYDVDTGLELTTRVHDRGDVFVKAMTPADAFEPVRAAVAAERNRSLTILIGGNNAITRPGVHGLGLEQAGLLTLDAHFDLRDTDQGLTNGNPVQALLEDGLPGRRISQVGLAPFANTRRAHEKAKAAGISVRTARDCRDKGLAQVVAEELARLSGECEAIYVDFDIDVIDRSQWPASPGARPGGVSAQDFFEATRLIGAHGKVRAVDLTEFDPSLEVGDLGSLTAGRWFCELVAGYEGRGRTQAP